MKEIEIVTSRRGFAFVDNALREVDVKGETLAVDIEGNTLNTLKVSDGNNEYEVNANKFYLSREDFEKNVPCKVCCYYGCDLIGEFNKSMPILVIQEDGEIKKELLHITRVSVDFCSKYHWEWRWKSNNPYHEDKCFLVNERTSAVSWANYNKINADGSVERVVGASNCVMLNDEQRHLVSRLKDLLKELKSNNVFLTMDYNQNLLAFNTENFDIEKDIDDLSNEYREIDWTNEKFAVAKMHEDLLSEYGEDWCFYLKPKNKKA